MRRIATVPSRLPAFHALVLRSVYLAATTCVMLGCNTLAAQRRTVHDEAQDLNVASRFGRLDVASQFAAPEAQRVFLERRKGWGDEIRVLDLQIDHVQVKDQNSAEVILQIDWTRPTEGLLRSTRLQQNWASKNQGPWRLQSERQIQGDRGLFGEKATAKYLTPAKDTHFQSRSLGSVE
jgi:hypothetical protein